MKIFGEIFCFVTESIENSLQLSSVNFSALQFPQTSKIERFWETQSYKKVYIFHSLQDFRKKPHICTRFTQIRVIKTLQLLVRFQNKNH